MQAFWILFVAFTCSAGGLRATEMEPVAFDQLLSAIAGRTSDAGAADVEFDRIEIDSRRVQPGDVFWALKGEQHDGHQFVSEAVSRGAAACVVDRHVAGSEQCRAILVPDTLQALWQFSNWYRKTQDALVIGVTGSFGKTTAREMIHAALSSRFSGVRSVKNFNNHIGLPLSLLSIESHHEFAVLEKGASRLGEIRDLARLAEPEVGVITGIGAAHLDGFGSEQGIVAAKGELLEALPENGFAVLAGDDPRVRGIAARAACPVIFVGEGDNNDLRAKEVEVTNQQIAFTADGHRYAVHACGRHHLYAALIGVAIGQQIGMDARDIAEGLRTFTAVPGRCQVETIGNWTVINDAYNANPASMHAACRLLQGWEGGHRKILLTGDMLELADRAGEFHREAGLRAAGSGIDLLIAFGSYAQQVIRGAIDGGMTAHRLAECRDFDAALAVLDCWLAPGDVLLVKGSRSTRMERVIEWLRQRKHNGRIETPDTQDKSRVCA